MMKGRWKSLFLVAIIASYIFSGCAAVNDKGTLHGQKNVPAADRIPVKVYFASHDADYLEAEIHRLNNDELVLQRTMEILVAGPRNTELWPVIPPATKVKSVIVKERTAYVDFSEEIVKSGFGGSSREVLAVAAIVNTLTEFTEVERVQILVEGKKVSTLFGHMDVSEPLSRSPGIIKGK